MSNTPTAARAALDDAIRQYAAAVDRTADEQGPYVVTGWVLITSGVRGSFNGDDGTAYITEAMPGQPYHAALGLWLRGFDHTRFGYEQRGDPE